MQRFIREKINSDKKSCLKNIKGARLPKFCKVKTTPKKTNFFQIYPNKKTVFKGNANSYHNALQPPFYIAFI